MARIDEELLSRFDSERQKAMLNIMFTANWLKSIQVQMFKPHGISPQQYNILRILRGAGDRMNMQNVKQRMIDRAPNATRLTDKLITKGLVDRARCDEDRRVVYVKISQKGLDLLAQIDETVRKEIQRNMDNLTPEEASTLSTLLDKIRS
jgi:MarR family transcriptional regulator, 2-MHQ and catechol-resistance regulon repressor